MASSPRRVINPVDPLGQSEGLKTIGLGALDVVAPTLSDLLMGRESEKYQLPREAIGKNLKGLSPSPSLVDPRMVAGIAELLQLAIPAPGAAALKAPSIGKALIQAFRGKNIPGVSSLLDEGFAKTANVGKGYTLWENPSKDSQLRFALASPEGKVLIKASNPEDVIKSHFKPSNWPDIVKTLPKAHQETWGSKVKGEVLRPEFVDTSPKLKTQSKPLEGEVLSPLSLKDQSSVKMKDLFPDSFNHSPKHQEMTLAEYTNEITKLKDPASFMKGLKQANPSLHDAIFEQNKKSVMKTIDDAFIAKALEKNPGASIEDIALGGMKKFPSKPLYKPSKPAILKSPSIESISSQLQPFDWFSYSHGDVPVGPNKFISEAAYQEALKQGYNLKSPLYKGGYMEYYPDWLINLREKKQYEKGLFFADKYNIASEYGKPLQYVARANNPVTVDWTQLTGKPHYNEHWMDPLVNAAHKRNTDLLQIRNIKDMGGMQNQYVVLDPKIIRAPSAEFDPLRSHLPAPLAGFGGLIVIGADGLPYVVGERKEDYFQ